MTEGTRCTGMSTTAFFAGLVAGIGTGLVVGASIRCPDSPPTPQFG